MNKKLLYTLIGIAIIAVIIYYAKNYQTETLDPAKGKIIISEGIYEDSIDKIHFKSDTVDFSVRKSDNFWIIENYNFPANTATLFNLLNRLNTEKIIETVTNNYDSFQKFGFREEGKQASQRITFSHNNKITADLLVGKNREGGGQYIKRENTDSIWLITNPLPIPAKEEDLLEKNIPITDRKNIAQIEVKTSKKKKSIYIAETSDESGDSSIRFVKKGRNKNEEAPEINNLTHLFSPLNYKSLQKEEAAKSKKSQKKQGSVLLTLKSGGTVSTDIYLNTSAKPNVYYLTLRLNDITDNTLSKWTTFTEEKVFEISEHSAKTLLME